jgi:hypothetical protein
MSQRRLRRRSGVHYLLFENEIEQFTIVIIRDPSTRRRHDLDWSRGEGTTRWTRVRVSSNLVGSLLDNYSHCNLINSSFNMSLLVYWLVHPPVMAHEHWPRESRVRFPDREQDASFLPTSWIGSPRQTFPPRMVLDSDLLFC